MSACVACGSEFQCGMADAGAADPCWCTQLPPLPALPPSPVPEAAAWRGHARCYCPACLRTLLAAPESAPESASGAVAQRAAGKA